MTDLIKHIIVVSFHHTQGNKIEFAYPEITPQEYADHKYDTIPFLAIPDGAHLSDEDSVMFTLLSKTQRSDESLYGAALFKQIDSTATAIKDDAQATRRGYVQKSICLISTRPLFGFLLEQLRATSGAYFSHSDLTSKDAQDAIVQGYTVAQAAAASLDLTLESERLRHATSSLNVARVMTRVGARTVLSLVKLALCEGKVAIGACRGGGVHAACELALLVAALLPRGLTAAPFYPGEGPDGTVVHDMLGFPLSVLGTIGSSAAFFSPYVVLQEAGFLAATQSFVVGASNAMLLTGSATPLDAAVDLTPESSSSAVAVSGTGGDGDSNDNGNSRGEPVLNVFTHKGKDAITLSGADKRFADKIYARLGQRNYALATLDRNIIAPTANALSAVTIAAFPSVETEADKEKKAQNEKDKKDEAKKINDKNEALDAELVEMFHEYVRSLLECAAGVVVALKALNKAAEGTGAAGADPALQKRFDELNAEFSEFGLDFLKVWTATPAFREWKKRGGDFAGFPAGKHPGGPSAIAEVASSMKPIAEKIEGAASSVASMFMSASTQMYRSIQTRLAGQNEAGTEAEKKKDGEKKDEKEAPKEPTAEKEEEKEKDKEKEKDDDDGNDEKGEKKEEEEKLTPEAQKNITDTLNQVQKTVGSWFQSFGSSVKSSGTSFMGLFNKANNNAANTPTPPPRPPKPTSQEHQEQPKAPSPEQPSATAPSSETPSEPSPDTPKQ